MIWCTCRICFGFPHALLSISLAPEQQRFYTSPKSNPRVSLSKGVTDQWWDLGPFVKHCNDITDWQPTLNPLIHFSPSEGVYTSSLNTTAFAQRSFFLFSHSSPLSVSTLLNTDTLMHPILLLLPSPLWAANQYDVGLIKGSEPFVITPKYNYRPKPWQYPLNPEATRCIRPLFESLLKAGVIVPCSNSPVHIHILPVKKIRDKRTTWWGARCTGSACSKCHSTCARTHFKSLQYFSPDELLVASPSEEQCTTNSVSLLTHLAAEVHKASFSKLQFLKTSLSNLGHHISAEGKTISKTLQSIEPTTTMCSRVFIPTCSQIEGPLRDNTHCPGSISFTPLQRHPEAEAALSQMKSLLQSSPTLTWSYKTIHPSCRWASRLYDFRSSPVSQR